MTKRLYDCIIVPMADMNLLNATFYGKLGTSYGTKWKNKEVVKAIPFSHTPHNEKQKKAVTAFSRLNRWASWLAKNFWPWLNLSDKGMYKHNAVAKWLKPCVNGYEFSPVNAIEVISDDGSMTFDVAEFESSQMHFVFELSNTPETPNPADEKIVTMFLTSEGVVKWGTVSSGEKVTGEGVINYIDFSFYYFIAFKSVPQLKGRKLTGFTLIGPRMVIVVYGIWYTMRMIWFSRPYIEDSVLYLSERNAEMDNGTIKITEV